LIVKGRSLANVVAHGRLDTAPFDTKAKSVESQTTAGLEVCPVTAPEFGCPAHRLYVTTPLGSDPVGMRHTDSVIASFGLIGRRCDPPQELPMLL
jgi:hypothetical protein